MRRTRVLIGMLGVDQHEIGALSVSHLLRDPGKEVIYAGRFNTPAGLVKTGVEEGVDLIGISCHSWEYLYYLPDLFRLMDEKGIRIPVLVGGSVVTPNDAKKLQEMGVATTFGPSSTDREIVERVEQIIEGKR
jgi:methylmalonyl-CoA mutase cobalamin-binding domain/chain